MDIILQEPVIKAAQYVGFGAVSANDADCPFLWALEIAYAAELLTASMHPPSDMLQALQIAWIFCGTDKMWHTDIDMPKHLDIPAVWWQGGNEMPRLQMLQTYYQKWLLSPDINPKTISTFIHTINTDYLSALDLGTNPIVEFVDRFHDARLLAPVIFKNPDKLVYMVGSRRGIGNVQAAQLTQCFLDTIHPKSIAGQQWFASRKALHNIWKSL
jgi:hypothetical protein